ncbi:MAG: hypothetical protein LBH05_06225 [Deferribacteraceae bacterium]|jgi:hypothetical protein|nr:hypothetical protein [Deferribacteraceae bacterium]
MKENNFTFQYILCVALMITTAAAIYFAKIIDIYSERLDSEIFRINKEMLLYDYNELRVRAQSLRGIISTLNIAPLDKNAAMTEILGYADLLNEKYGAVVTDNPRDTDGTLILPMLMSYVPADSADFMNTLSALTGKGKPAVFINELSWELTDTVRGVYTVKIKLELSEPYMAEAK